MIEKQAGHLANLYTIERAGERWPIEQRGKLFHLAPLSSILSHSAAAATTTEEPQLLSEKVCTSEMIAPPACCNIQVQVHSKSALIILFCSRTNFLPIACHSLRVWKARIRG